MTRLQEELKLLRDSLMDMANLVKLQLQKSIYSLLEVDEDLANEVLYNEKRVNAFELKNDSDCERIFTLLNPMANDMRFVFSTLKINADLERIGDYAEGIAKLVLHGNKSFDTELVQHMRVKEMADSALIMMDEAARAYSEDDTRLARSIFAKDMLLNEINREASHKAEEYILTHMDKIQQALLLISIVRKLERVGDHVTNIAEEVIFFKEAKILKHVDKRNDNTFE